MLLDILENSKKYEALSPRFAQAFAYLRKFDGSQALGRHAIDGDNVFALVQKYVTKPLENLQFEVHRKYIDVQYIHAGRETILWAPLAGMEVETMAYDEKQDAALFKLIPHLTPLHLRARHFAILFPEDAHAPCGVWDEAGEVSKIVVKVKTT